MTFGVTNGKNDTIYTVKRLKTSVLPSVPLPFYLRSVGHFIFRTGMLEHYPARQFVQMYWCASGQGEFLVDGKPNVMNPGDVIYRLPGEEHIHRSLTPKWEYRWFAFDGPRAADFMLSYGYPRVCFHAGKIPQDLFLKLEVLLRERSDSALRSAVSVCCDIFARAGNTNDGCSPEDTLMREMMRLCHENYQDPSWNVNELAETAGINRSTVRHIFQKWMNQVPGRYIADLRLQKALGLLTETTLPIKELYAQCGFSDVSYFCKIIRKETGQTPENFRSTHHT